MKMLYKWVRELTSKFSFIEKAELKGTLFYMWYRKDSVLKYKKLPYRANKNKLLKTIEEIKKDIDYIKLKKERDKIVLTELENEEKKKKIFEVV
jgi:hypothetical protein